MPNHIHGLISINLGAGDRKQNSLAQIPPLRPYAIYRDNPTPLGTIIRAYKSAVTYRINAMRDATSPLIWQRNYYEHIIRNDKDYENIYKYIESNPSNWTADQLHPSATTDSNNPSSPVEV